MYLVQIYNFIGQSAVLCPFLLTSWNIISYLHQIVKKNFKLFKKFFFGRLQGIVIVMFWDWVKCGMWYLCVLRVCVYADIGTLLMFRNMIYYII